MPSGTLKTPLGLLEYKFLTDQKVSIYTPEDKFIKLYSTEIRFRLWAELSEGGDLLKLTEINLYGRAYKKVPKGAEKILRERPVRWLNAILQKRPVILFRARKSHLQKTIAFAETSIAENVESIAKLHATNIDHERVIAGLKAQLRKLTIVAK